MKARLGREKAPRPSPARPSSHIAAGRYAPVNGLQLYYEVYGTGRPLVLLHGGLMTIDLTFGPLIPALAEDHQVIGIELQGHGHTADIDRPMAIEILADDVVTLLGQLGIEQADFFGFSLGGLVDLALVLRHPGLVGKLVVASADYRSRPPAADADPRRMMPSGRTSRRCATRTTGLPQTRGISLRSWPRPPRWWPPSRVGLPRRFAPSPLRRCSWSATPTSSAWKTRWRCSSSSRTLSWQCSPPPRTSG